MRTKRSKARPSCLHACGLAGLLAACGGRVEDGQPQVFPESSDAGGCTTAPSTPTPLLTQPLDGKADFFGTLSFGTYLYFNVYRGGVANPEVGDLFRLPKSGGEPERIASGFISDVAASSDDRTVAWLSGETRADGNGTVYRTLMVRSSDEIHTVHLPSASILGDSLAVGNHGDVLLTASGRLLEWSLSTQALTTLYQGGVSFSLLLPDGDDVRAVGVAGSAVLTLTANGATHEIARGANDETNALLGVAAGYVYFGVYRAALLLRFDKAPLSGGASTTVFRVPLGNSPPFIWMDDRSIYWQTETNGLPPHVVGDYRVPLSGDEPPETVLQDPGISIFSRPTVDGCNLYWVDHTSSGYQIMARAK